MTLAIVIALASPLAQADPIPVPGPVPVDEGQDVDGQSIDTPPATVPAPCTADPCNEETPTPPVDTETPEVPSQEEETPTVPFPEVCVLPEAVILVCVGPFAFPAIPVGPTPAVPSQPVVVQSQDLPAACPTLAAAGAGCPPATPVESQHAGDTPAVSVHVATPGLTGVVDPHAAETVTIGPFEGSVDVPVIGPVPYRYCVSGCPQPVPPEGVLEWSLAVTVTVGPDTYTVSRQVSQEV